MWYPVRTPTLFKWAYKHCLWQKTREEAVVYLTFDDGPHPEITAFVLDELKKWEAKASFFCIGENVARYPDVFKRIKDEGHTIGNHTMHHLNGWKTKDDTYLDDIRQAAKLISSDLFRPPYGRIRFSQLQKLDKKMKVVMWSLLSGDFDVTITPEKCLNNVISNIKNGDIIVFHDSIKAKKNLIYTLPLVLNFLRNNGYVCKPL